MQVFSTPVHARRIPVSDPLIMPVRQPVQRRRASPQLDDEPSMEEAMRQVRVVVRTMLGGRTIEQSAGLADVSTNTLVRILRGENLTLATFAKIVSRLGGNLVIKVER